ncbi:hypothetical protein [Cohnella hongkongensis]|uniref:Chemotaxis protein n=1 Tax=Cohnella hongkongensis TaxID=178337 RepID=A0ABV9FBX8_9BACL
MDTAAITIDYLDKLNLFISDKLDYCSQNEKNRDSYREYIKHYQSQIETLFSIRYFMVTQFAATIDSLADLSSRKPDPNAYILFATQEVKKSIEEAARKTKHFVKESNRAANFKGPEHLRTAQKNLAVLTKNGAEQANTEAFIASHASYARLADQLEAPAYAPLRARSVEVIASAKQTVGFMAEVNLLRKIYTDQLLENHYERAIAQSEETLRLLQAVIEDMRKT